MNKLIFGSSLLCVLFLIAGSYLFPDSTVMWLAGNSTGYTIFRIGICLMLLTVLFTHTPRKMYVRLLMGGLAVGLLGWGTNLVLQNSMQLLDIVLSFELGIAFLVATLEITYGETDDEATIPRFNHSSMPTTT